MLGFNITSGENSLHSPRPRSKTTPRSSDSPTTTAAEVGEIDTRAPFKSVKAALNLFREAAAEPSPKPKPKPPVPKKQPKDVDEMVLEKETRLHLALKELDEFRARYKATETTAAQASRDLDKATRTLQELTNKLEIVGESKHTAMEVTESAKIRATQLEEHKSSREQVAADAWKIDVDSEREQYKASAARLIQAKQQLNTLRQDFDVILQAKLAASREAGDAQHFTQVNRDKVIQLSREITNSREVLAHIKLASLQSEEEQEKSDAETLARLQSHKAAKEEVERNIESLKEEYGLEHDENLEDKLEETTENIKGLKEQLDNMRESDLSSWDQATSELDGAKRNVQEILEEQRSLRTFVDVLKLELDHVKLENSVFKNKATEEESAAESLQTDLDRNKVELQVALAGKIDPQDAFDMQIKIDQLLSEAENVRQEAENINKSVVVLEQEAEAASIIAKNAEERLQIAVNELEQAKAAEKRAGDAILSSTKRDASQVLESQSSGKIKLSLEDFESLSNKVERSKADADIKVATVMAQIETIKANENEAVKELERSEKENEQLEGAIEDALKQAEMAEAAKQVVEGELRKWREKEEDIAECSHSREYIE